MAESPPSIEFARALLALKRRTGRGYRDLASSIYVSPATLHRYCAGKALPADFAFVKRMARLAGVRAGEVDSLYRLWLRAQLDGGPAHR
jgi:Helix-turn-helix domain